MSDYSGDVEVGGATAERRLPGLGITKIAVGPMDNNAYLLECAVTGDVLLIDAANEPARLLEEIGEHRLVRVVTTHRHPDHWQGLREVVATTAAPVAAHGLDAGELPVPVSEVLADGDPVTVGEVALRVIHLVGHTPGSIALHLDADGGHLFSGDSLFPGGPGNTFGSAANFVSLMDDLERKVFAELPDSTWVYPGHGKDTTLGAERPSIPQWRARGW